MADKAHLKTDKELLKMERHLSAIYSRTGKELEEKATEFFKQFKKADEAKKGLVKAGQLSEEEYARWRRTQIMTGERWKRLQEQAAQELLNANRTAQAYINGKLPDMYAMNYNAAGKTVSNAVRGYSFELVDASTVKNLATSDKTLLPYKYVDGKKDVRWNTQKINSEVLQGLLQGESMDKIAARFRTAIPEMDKVSAIRNARTSVTGAENKGRMDSYKEAQEKGVKMVRVWISAHDRRVRPEHLELDKQEAALDEPFHNSIGDIMYPGDPNADPANVYNCRCSLITRIIGFSKSQRTEQRSEGADREDQQERRFVERTVQHDIEPAQSQTVTADKFVRTLDTAKASCPDDKAWRVDTTRTAQDFKNEKITTYITKGGSTFALKEDGDIISVCKNQISDAGTNARSLLAAAVEAGGTHLDSFDGNYGFYVRCGFEPVSRCKFSVDYAPPGWVSGRDKEEDIYFMKYVGVGNVKYKSIEDARLNIPYSDGYDEAEAVVKKLIKGR